MRGYVAAALDAFGTIDVLFNNAAIIGPIGALAEYDEEAFDRIMAINVRGVFLGLRHVLPIMLAQRSGSIINTGSLSSERGLPGTPAYNAAKHAVLGLTRSAAAEVAHAGVRVNAVLPGMIDTPMLRGGHRRASPTPTAARRAAEGVSPQGRLGQAGGGRRRSSTFLASDAASLVNGAAWAVDGGILGDAPDREAAVSTRDGLVGHVDRYLAALATNDPAGLPLAAGVRYTENGQELELGPRTVGRPRRASPTTTTPTSSTTSGAQIGWIGVVDEHDRPSVVFVRLARARRADRRGRDGRPAPARAPLRPVDDARAARDRVRGAPARASARDARRARSTPGNATSTALEQADGSIIPVTDDCTRFENGTRTVRVEDVSHLSGASALRVPDGRARAGRHRLLQLHRRGARPARSSPSTRRAGSC